MRGRAAGSFPQEIKGASKAEHIEPAILQKLVRRGTAVVPSNPRHKNLRPCAIGEGLRVKVNANIGTSRDYIDIEEEIEKVRGAIRFGADAVMDLSTGGNIREIRKRVVRASSVPV